MQPVLEIPGVMVGGSQVPNLLEPDAAATLVVSQDVDLVIPVVEQFAELSDEEKKSVTGSLAILSLMASVPDMPDPARARKEIATLIARLEAIP